MQRVDYRDIKIESPYDIINLQTLTITAEPNQHLKLSYKAIIPEEKKDEYVPNSQYTDQIKVEQYKDGSLVRTLFSGQLSSIQVKAHDDIHYLIIEALSYTYDMDLAFERRSYQDESMTYDAMIQSVIKDYNDPDFIQTVAKGEPIDIFTLEYDETDWEFLKRMA